MCINICSTSKYRYYVMVLYFHNLEMIKHIHKYFEDFYNFISWVIRSQSQKYQTLERFFALYSPLAKVLRHSEKFWFITFHKLNIVLKHVCNICKESKSLHLILRDQLNWIRIAISRPNMVRSHFLYLLRKKYSDSSHWERVVAWIILRKFVSYTIEKCAVVLELWALQNCHFCKFW